LRGPPRRLRHLRRIVRDPDVGPTRPARQTGRGAQRGRLFRSATGLARSHGARELSHGETPPFAARSERSGAVARFAGVSPTRRTDAEVDHRGGSLKQLLVTLGGIGFFLIGFFLIGLLVVSFFLIGLLFIRFFVIGLFVVRFFLLGFLRLDDVA